MLAVEFGAWIRTEALGKYRISKGRVRPFVESGLSVLPVENTDTRGITAGSGIEMPVSRLNITPAVRYTNWVTNRGRGAFPNQVQFVVGVSEASDAISPTAFGRELSLGVVAGLALSEGLRPSSPTEHLTWEFPFLMKYKVNRPRVSPFAELGPSLSAIAHVTPRDHSHYGITGGAGVQARLSRLKIAPAIRYTRWARDKNRFGQDTYLSTRQHQIELVIGFSFQGR
jgi:hypothetical protein